MFLHDFSISCVMMVVVSVVSALHHNAVSENKLAKSQSILRIIVRNTHAIWPTIDPVYVINKYGEKQSNT